MMAPANQYPQIVYSSTAFICVWLRAAVETLGHFTQLLGAEKDAWMQEPFCTVVILPVSLMCNPLRNEDSQWPVSAPWVLWSLPQISCEVEGIPELLCFLPPGWPWQCGQHRVSALTGQSRGPPWWLGMCVVFPEQKPIFFMKVRFF